MKKTLFIADLHLSEETLNLNKMFHRFAQHLAQDAERVYILGDLFDFWIGDDEKSYFIERIQYEIRKLTEKGVECFFIKGNRDFLLGEKFAQSCGLKILPEYCVIDLYGTPTLLCHGDTLCTDDVEYQKYRRKVHQKWRQWIFLHLPLWIRLRIAHKIRHRSEQDKQYKNAQIMDVNQKFVDQIVAEYGVTQLIHGHIHKQLIDKQPNYQRIALGDWGKTWSIFKVYASGEQVFIN